MPIQIDVFDFKCFNQLRNGKDFDLNLPEFTPNLVGNIGETVKVEYKANIQQSANTEGAEEWFILNDPSFKQIERSSGSFLEDGIQVGDVFLFFANWENRRSTADEYSGVVDFISSDGRQLQYSVTAGTDSTAGTVTNVGLSFFMPTGTNANGALFVKFGLLSNEETFNFVSKTTESQQVYYAGGLVSDNIPRDAESLGSIKDWVSGNLTVEFTSENPDFRGAQYRVTHTFVLNPFYILSYREFIENGTIPDILAGDSSLKYAAELEFRKTLSNTGSSKIQQFDSLGGFVGWYGENFNGLNADYRIVSIDYEEAVSGDPLDAININTPTKATITVENINGAISDYSCAAYIFRVPDSEDDYIGTTTDLLENFLFKSDIVSSPDTSSTDIVTSLVGGNLVIEYTVDYTVAEKLQLTTDDEFILLVQVEDPTISAGNSDRMMLLSDFKNYVDIDFLAGFIDVDTYEFFQLGQTLGVDEGLENLTVSNEDGLLLNALIGADTTRNVVINDITISLVAYNPLTGQSFELDTYPFNLGDPVISGGVQQIEVDNIRGYPLVAGDDFNLARITTEGQDGVFQQYGIQIGQKIKWQDWIFNAGVDNVFFDASQPNNNLNEKSSNYSNKQNYQIRLALVVNVTGLDDLGRTITGDFINYGGTLTVLDYDESDNAVTGQIETFDLETGNSLSGGILYNGKDTLFRTVFQNAASMLTAVHRIEPSQNPGDGILELSSVAPPDPSNLLKPLGGETELTFDLVGSVLTTECLINGELIQEGVAYKLSARTLAYPTPPTNVMALPINRQSLQVTWDHPGASQFIVRFRPTGTVPWGEEILGDVREVFLCGLTDGIEYEVQVNADGGDFSSSVFDTVPYNFVRKLRFDNVNDDARSNFAAIASPTRYTMVAFIEAPNLAVEPTISPFEGNIILEAQAGPTIGTWMGALRITELANGIEYQAFARMGFNGTGVVFPKNTIGKIMVAQRFDSVAQELEIIVWSNGVRYYQMDTTTAAYIANTDIILLGHPNSSLSADVLETRIIPQLISDNDLEDYYNEGFGSKVLDGFTHRSWYKLTESSGNSSADASGNGQTLTLQNFTTIDADKWLGDLDASLSATVLSSSSIRVDWEIECYDSFNVQYSTDRITWVDNNVGDVRTLTLLGLTSGTEYFIRIQSDGDMTEIISATTL